MAFLRQTTIWFVATMAIVGVGCQTEIPDPGDPIGVLPPSPTPLVTAPEGTSTPVPTDPWVSATETPTSEPGPTPTEVEATPPPETVPPETPRITETPETATPTPQPGTPRPGPDSDGDGSTDELDCNDNNPAIYPGAAEICNATDDDCDGLVDAADVGSPLQNWYKDVDGDTWGDDDQVIHACQQPQGSVARGGDCNDSSALINPDATEVCDGKDNDCDDRSDDLDDSTANKPKWYKDLDSDGWGGSTVANTCSRPLGYVAIGGDCDDSSGAIHPEAGEICNGVDDDCDGFEDDEDDVSNGPVWYYDEDGDGFGSDEEQVACSQPDGYVEQSGDCDDEDVEVNPDTLWYADDDGDNYGDDTNTRQQCESPDNYLRVAGDCDDQDSTIHPGGIESCDGQDQDCDGTIDDGVVVEGGLSWWQADGNAQDSVGIYNGTSSGDLSYGVGHSQEGFVFDGSGDKVSFGPSIGNFGTGDFTIEFWMKTPNRGNQAILGKRPSCEHTTYFDLRTSGQALKWEMEESSGTALTLLSVSKIADDVWHHVVLVRRGLTAELYIDAQLESTKTGASAPHLENSANFEIGVSACTGKDGTTWFKGSLDEIVVYGRGFSESEVGQLYTLGSVVRCVEP